jgi:hypothetical protein
MVRDASRAVPLAQRTAHDAQRAVLNAERMVRNAQRTVPNAERITRDASRTVPCASRTFHCTPRTIRGAFRTVRSACGAARDVSRTVRSACIAALEASGTARSALRRAAAAHVAAFEPSAPPPRAPNTVFSDLCEALPDLPEVFDRHDIIRLLGYVPARATLARALASLKDEGLIAMEMQSLGGSANRYRKLPSADG